MRLLALSMPVTAQMIDSDHPRRTGGAHTYAGLIGRASGIILGAQQLIGTPTTGTERYRMVGGPCRTPFGPRQWSALLPRGIAALQLVSLAARIKRSALGRPRSRPGKGNKASQGEALGLQARCGPPTRAHWPPAHTRDGGAISRPFVGSRRGSQRGGHRQRGNNEV